MKSYGTSDYEKVKALMEKADPDDAYYIGRQHNVIMVDSMILTRFRCDPIGKR